MEMEEKKEFALMVRDEMRIEIRSEIKASEERMMERMTERIDSIDRKLGIFWESMNDKFTLVFEAFDYVYKKLDEHTELFKDIYKKLDTKAEVKELDALDRRVTKLEGSPGFPLRSG